VFTLNALGCDGHSKTANRLLVYKNSRTETDYILPRIYYLYAFELPFSFYPCGVHPVALCICIPLKYTCDRN
jgi:hypothetical protein